MSRIPGVPTLDPVNKPMMSPAEAGKPGQAVASLGEASNDVAATGLELDLYMKKAQEHVDELAARNDANAVYAQVMNQLKKTQNSRDVPGVIEQGKKALNDLASQWSHSPAAVEIQMQLDSLHPALSEEGTGKQIDLMGKEFNTTLDQQAEVLAANYANDRAAGGNGDMALGSYATALDGGKKTGLIGDVEAEDKLRKFRQKGQSLQINNAIANANPDVNQRVYDDIVSHPENFPDVTKEQLDNLKGQALAAVEAHIKYQDWAEGQMALRTRLVPKINEFTNPATGRFDEGAAMTDNAERFARGEITKTQADVLASSFNSHATQMNVQYKQQADKIKNDVVDLFHKNEYTQANAVLEQHKNDPEFEQNFEALTKYGDQVQREKRAETREDYTLHLQLHAEQSSETLGNILSALSQGRVFTDAQIYGLAGEGKGKLKSADAMEAIRASKAYESDPNTQAAVKLLTESFPTVALSRTATPEEIAAAATPNAKQNKRIVLTYQQWQQRVNQNPNEDKVQAMKEVLQPAIQDHIADQINHLFGVAPHPGDSGSWLTRAPGESWSQWFEHRTGHADDDKPAQQKSAPIVQHSASTGAYRYSDDGGKTWNDGQPPSRPANIPDDYIFNSNGPKGGGWYAPAAR